jgi:hypothetical protein
MGWTVRGTVELTEAGEKILADDIEARSRTGSGQMTRRRLSKFDTAPLNVNTRPRKRPEVKGRRALIS